MNIPQPTSPAAGTPQTATPEITPAEIIQYRNETAGTRKTIHFNNAGASLPPDCVVQKMVDYLHEEALNGGYETEARYKQELDNTYELIARLINADPGEIAIVENASMAWSLAFNGLSFSDGDVVITSEMEYVTNLLAFLNIRQKHGIRILVIPNDKNGNFCLQDLEDSITPQTKLIAITHIASGGGAMMPVEAIGRIARKHGILYLVDACQTVGHTPIDVEKIGCDMLSATGRKYLRAPRGTGFLYVRKEVQDRLSVWMMDGHTAQLTSETTFSIRNDGRRFELYEKNRALILGLSKAVEYTLSIGADRIWQRIQYLAALLQSRLNTLPQVTVHDTGDHLTGIVTFSIGNIDSQLVKKNLATRHINVSIALASSTLLYMNKHRLQNIIRASVHYYNTEEEIGILCSTVAAIIADSPAV